MTEPRYRCPNTGLFVSEFNCMFCNNPPNDDYEICWAYNVIDPEGEIPFKPRWDNKGRDLRKKEK